MKNLKTINMDLACDNSRQTSVPAIDVRTQLLMYMEEIKMNFFHGIKNYAFGLCHILSPEEQKDLGIFIGNSYKPFIETFSKYIDDELCDNEKQALEGLVNKLEVLCESKEFIGCGARKNLNEIASNYLELENLLSKKR